ncbi:MAG: hypothetical protein KJ645_02265 [Planctomycetes bacterium]|nr:hypothetical protein [Planctomycetota bacterium]
MAIAVLVPPPRQHLVTYHGVLAPNAALRDLVIPRAKPVPGSSSMNRRETKNLIPLDEAPETERQRRYTFAELMRRVFDVNVLKCPHCAGRRELIALITEAPVIRAILECLKLPADPPAVAGARWALDLYAPP